ncbi:hypothetical protein [Metabacillus sp. 84]|uniref:hypothetical protein n=1 Tax=Metabacillus sp. 84 TaxID=3404705 RepID=UPI003CF554CF
MSKKQHSKEMQNHKKPMDPHVLQEEFGSEFGDANSGKIYDIKEQLKRNSCQE